jgi:cell division protein FtsB
MNLDAGTVIALVSLAGVIVTAWLGQKGKTAEIKTSGMNDLNDALQDELKRKDREIERLEKQIAAQQSEIGTLRAVLRGD